MKYDLNEARYYDILEQHNVFLKKANDRITAINATVDEADLPWRPFWRGAVRNDALKFWIG